MSRNKKKIIRAATVPMSLSTFLEGSIETLMERYELVLVSSPDHELYELEQRYGHRFKAESGELRDGLRVVAVPMERHISLGKDMRALVELIRVFRRERPVMVHSMTPKAGLLCMMAAWVCRVPRRVHTFTGLVWPTAVGLKRRILMLTDWVTCACATHIIPEGEGVKNDLQAHITRKPMRVLGYGNVRGVDMERFDPKRIAAVLDKNRKNPSADGETSSLLSDSACLSESKLSTANQNHIAATCSSSPSSEAKNQKYLSSNIPTPSSPTSKPFTFLFVGRIVGDKGINELVDAFLRLREHYLDENNGQKVRLVLVGPTEDALDPLQQITWDRIRCTPSIIEVGPVWGEDILKYYAVSDCFVFPSYREGFPNTVLEAGAMGLPSIVTDINGSREIIIEGENGVIVPSKDADALYRAMLGMVDNPERTAVMASKARGLIESRYEQGFVRKCQMEFYDEILGGC